MFGGDETKSARPMPTAGPEVPQSQVIGELTKLNHLSDSFLKGIEELEIKLSGVLRQRNPEADGNEKLSQEQVPLAEAIRVITAKLNNALNNIYSINDRLEL